MYRRMPEVGQITQSFESAGEPRDMMRVYGVDAAGKTHYWMSIDGLD